MAQPQAVRFLLVDHGMVVGWHEGTLEKVNGDTAIVGYITQGKIEYVAVPRNEISFLDAPGGLHPPKAPWR